MKRPGFNQDLKLRAAQDFRCNSSLWLFRHCVLPGIRNKAEHGFALPIAIVAGLVLMIGVAALSSRTSQGFVSSIFQGANREARDIAESAILGFGVTMNREENRLLLVAGNGTDWDDEKNQNICTASTQGVDSSWSSISSSSVADAVNLGKFSTLGEWKPLVGSDTTRQFKVTKIEYLYEDADGERSPFGFNHKNTNFPSDDPSYTKSVRDSALEGGTRTLLRVTVVARVDRNGQQSYARVAREFEVVPKCCKRSFGNNIGAIAWGRDSAPCPVSKSTGVGNGLIGSLDGGAPSGSSNEIDIRNEENELITQALCWAGNKSGDSSDLVGTPSAACLNGSQSLGKAYKNKTSLSFLPTKFSLKLPSGGGLLVSKIYTTNTRIYFDTSTGMLMEKQGSTGPVPLANCMTTSGTPYTVVDCRFTSIDAGNNVVTIDTSHAKINFHFDDPSFTGDYMGGSGNTVYQRVHCERSVPFGACSTPVTWSGFQVKCDTVPGSDPNCASGKNSDFDQSELFNAFASGTGTFNLNGTRSTVGLNVYAPFASVTLKGGGNADPNFMGRIWTDTITLIGNVKLRVPNGQPSFCLANSCPPPSKVPLFDVVARSFSHASGF